MKSFKFIQFYYKQDYKYNYEAKKYVECEHFYTEKLGSDGVLVVDGRLSLANIDAIAIQRIKQLERVAKLDAYSVHYGTFSDNQVIKPMEILK